MRAGVIETLVFRNTDRIDRTEELGVILRLVKDYGEEIAATQLAIRDLDLLADDYDLGHAVLMTELRRLRSLPAEPPGYWAQPTGRSEGDAFRAMTFEERQAFIKLWTLTVFAPGNEPRWRLSRDR
jgi:peptidoglycan/xylan/chitin deacetylase (PgdA/CDA1 family)